jgi:hypothetical protein
VQSVRLGFLPGLVLGSRTAGLTDDFLETTDFGRPVLAPDKSPVWTITPIHGRIRPQSGHLLESINTRGRILRVSPYNQWESDKRSCRQQEVINR